jgi:hypothetical protein
MLIDAGQVFAMAFLQMVPDQNWLTERDHFESLAGGEMRPVEMFSCLAASSRKRAAFSARWDSKLFIALEQVGLQLKGV